MKKPTLLIEKPSINIKTLTCDYVIDGVVYSNSYIFPEPIPQQMQSSRLLSWVGVLTAMGMFGIDYFESIVCNFYLDKSEIDFFEKLFFLGLGEFRLVNSIPINTKTQIKVSPGVVSHYEDLDVTNQMRPLLLNGGGKDGSASAYLLNQSEDIPFTWFQRGNSLAQERVTNAWDAPVFVLQRHLDPRRKNGKYSGHRPMSASIAMLSLFSAQAFGYSHVITSNEASANEGNMNIDGFLLNHQYSKSLEFEQDLSKLLIEHNIGVRYFSLLRSLHEIQIAKIITKLKPKQLSAITSCNNGTSTATWCMDCPKCAFVALVVTAIDPKAAQNIWGKQVINKPALLSHIIELSDPTTVKPLECVGTVPECQVALGLLKQHKELILSTDMQALITKFGAQDSSKIQDFLTNLEFDLVPNEFDKTKAVIEQLIA